MALTLNEYCTGIADAIRTKEGSTEKIPAPDHKARILAIETGENLDTELATQDTLIADILTALDGKAAATGSTIIEVTMITCADGSLHYYDENRNEVTVPESTQVTAKVLGGYVFSLNSPGAWSATGDYMDRGGFYIFLSDGGSIELTD